MCTTNYYYYAGRVGSFYRYDRFKGGGWFAHVHLAHLRSL